MPRSSQIDQGTCHDASRQYAVFMEGDQIKRIRVRLGLAQSQCAALLSVHPQTWRKWERGSRQPRDLALGLLEQIDTWSSAKSAGELEEVGRQIGRTIQRQGGWHALQSLMALAYGDQHGDVTGSATPI